MTDRLTLSLRLLSAPLALAQDSKLGSSWAGQAVWADLRSRAPSQLGWGRWHGPIWIPDFIGLFFLDSKDSLHKWVHLLFGVEALGKWPARLRLCVWDQPVLRPRRLTHPVFLSAPPPPPPPPATCFPPYPHSTEAHQSGPLFCHDGSPHT
jgi:hypothetical protein